MRANFCSKVIDKKNLLIYCAFNHGKKKKYGL